MKHTSMPLDFRLAAWPYGGAYVTTFSDERYNFDLHPIFEYIKDQLKRLPVAHVNKTQFTLVNLYSSYTQQSVGLSVAPDKEVMRGPVVFTFSMSAANSVGTPTKRFWQERTCVWGTAGRSMSDFISISLPPDIAARARMYNMMEYDQRGLYNVVGGLTKALIRSNPVTNSEIFHASIPHAMWKHAISDWQYVFDFWRRMPALLELNIDQEFLAYWHDRIAPVFTPPAEYMEQIVEGYRSFLLRYKSNTLVKADTQLLYLIGTENLTEIETVAAGLARGIK